MIDVGSRGATGVSGAPGLCPNSSVWMWEHILQGRPERFPVRLSLAPRAAQWYSNATVQGFADIRPSELAKRTKDLRMRPDEQGYRFILNELVDREIIWCPYQGGPDDELVAVREGVHLFTRDIRLHAPQIVSRLVVSRVARQFGSHQVVLPPEPAMSQPIFSADEEASGDYEMRWRDITHRNILPESYSGGSSYSIRNCTEAMETLLSLRVASPVGMGCEGTRPLGDNSGEGTSTRLMFDVELALRGEVLRLSGLVRGKRGLREELRLRGAIIDALADTSERDRDLAVFEATRMRLEGELQTLRAEMDRLQAEAYSEHDKALAERDASEAKVNELHAKLMSYEASMQSGVIVASVPSRLSLSEEGVLIHDQYAERMDPMARCHEEVVADL